jgi:aspartyl-tRNA(Asn)/glutamyl-tRNA(Gln) amidotransferase subunit A
LSVLDKAEARPIGIGAPTAWLERRVAPEARQLVEAAIDTLAGCGAVVKEIALPDPSEAVAALMAILMPEAAAWHLRWLRERPDDYSSAVRERLELGAMTPAIRYLQGQQARRTLTEAFLAGMAEVDIVAMPTAPTPATLLESDLTVGEDADPDALAALVDFTAPFDLTGFPAISVPCGFTMSGLPVGLQLVARPWREDLLLAIAHGYERAAPWHRRLPPTIA